VGISCNFGLVFEAGWKKTTTTEGYPAPLRFVPDPILEFEISFFKSRFQPLPGLAGAFLQPLRSLQAWNDKPLSLSRSRGEIGEKGLSQNAMKSP
jgi:hypothetical protein